MFKILLKIEIIQIKISISDKHDNKMYFKDTINKYLIMTI